MEEIPILGLGTWKVRRPLGRRGAVPSFDTRLRGEPSTWGHLPQPPQVQMAAGTWKGPTSGFWKMECLDIRFSRIEDCPSQSLVYFWLQWVFLLPRLSLVALAEHLIVLASFVGEPEL